MPRLAPLLLAVCVSCSTESASPPAATPEPGAPAAHEASSELAVEPAAVDGSPGEYELDEARAIELREAARDYLAWGRVDERPNLAPVLCRAPIGDDFGVASQIRLSGADESPHGRKLYFLFAGPTQLGGRERYTRLGQPGVVDELPVGFTVVKQSWTAEPGPTSEPTPAPNPSTLAAPPPVTSLEHQGQRLHAGEQRELFVMTKVGPRDTPGTDLGWIYGTITPDGQTVTSAGRVERCMSCHEHADHERLFGLKR